MKSILATTSSFGIASPEAVDALNKAGFELIVNPFGRKLTAPELDALLAKHRPLGLLAGTEPIERKTLAKASNHLRALARVGVGWNNVDRDAALALGIRVSRTEGVLDQAVAELTIGFILAALRNIPQQDREVRSGTWNKRMGRLFSGKTLGIVGMGAIGRRVAELASAFKVRVIYYDLVKADGAYGERYDLNRLLAEADAISLHVSSSCCLLGREQLMAVKPGAILVNTARGELIDEKALADRLASGHIAAACLDVFESEPYSGPLANSDTTILSPHIGSYAVEARVAMENKAVENLLADMQKQEASS